MRTVVIMDTADYVKSCKIQLNNKEFLEKLGKNPTLSYAKIDLQNEYIT